MTEIQFNEIKQRLAKWREERHLTYENQMEGFLGNVFEEVSEYFRAKDDLEKVDALCDIAVLMINSFEFLEYVSFAPIEKKVDIFQIIEHFTGYFIEYRDKIKYSNDYKEFEYLMIIEIEYLINNLGFDFYKCMMETIKEIESRTGEYNENLKKFIKHDGAYTESEACELARKEFINYCVKKHKPFDISQVFQIRDDIMKGYWFIEIYNSRDKNSNEYCLLGSIIKKWYKADYESCRL